MRLEPSAPAAVRLGANSLANAGIWAGLQATRQALQVAGLEASAARGSAEDAARSTAELSARLALAGRAVRSQGDALVHAWTTAVSPAIDRLTEATTSSERVAAVDQLCGCSGLSPAPPSLPTTRLTTFSSPVAR